jgi:hypothetical protein
MNRLGESRIGRCVLHLLAMAGDREFCFHGAGIRRELWRTAA